MPVNKAINKAATSARMPVNKAINKVDDAAVFIDLVGELGPLIYEAAASAQAPVDEPIDKAAAKKYLNASPGSTSEVLCHFSLCANFGNKTLLPIMTPLPRNWTPNT